MLLIVGMKDITRLKNEIHYSGSAQVGWHGINR